MTNSFQGVVRERLQHRNWAQGIGGPSHEEALWETVVVSQFYSLYILIIHIFMEIYVIFWSDGYAYCSIIVVDD